MKNISIHILLPLVAIHHLMKNMRRPFIKKIIVYIKEQTKVLS